MCGLVGIASVNTLTADERSMFTQLLCVDTLRGPHSTGIFSVDKGNEINMFKRAVDGWTFVEMNKYDSLVSRGYAINILAGHNRWATCGKVNYDNAHPFNHSDVVMMHNGTLTSQRSLGRSNQFGTDSECIAYNLSQVEPDKAGEVISKINGAFALCWYDDRDKSLNFVRNEQRPLYISVDDHDKPSRVMWASEAPMINFVVGRTKAKEFKTEEPFLLGKMNHIKFIPNEEGTAYDYTIQEYEEYIEPKVVTIHHNNGGGKGKKQQGHLPYYLPDLNAVVRVHTYNFRNYGKNKEKGCVEALFEFKNPSSKAQDYVQVEVHNVHKAAYDKWQDWVPVRVNSYNYAQDTMYASPFEGTVSKSLFEEETDTQAEDAYAEAELGDLNTVSGPHGVTMSLDDFNRMTKSGCAFCTTNVTPEEVIWTNNGECLCGECGGAWAVGDI